MAASFVGRGMFPKLWILICKLWVYIVSIGCLIMPLAVWVMIFIQNTKTFADTMDHYLGNDQKVYDRFDGDPNAGYVGNTNIPKHLGGPVFAAIFDVAMWIFIVIAMCADLFWKFPICKQFLESVWTDGLYEDLKFIDVEFFFLVANAFLKLFIVAATGAQTYTGLKPNQDDPKIDTPLFCLYATLCLAVSIPFTLIALFYIIHGMKMREYKDELKAAEEAAKAKK
ncbi:hypothetical protein I204_08088 [Kwoniella mangroviensis CBS 8886]|uniref:uncharacterized protein n=1 Tax=Kwoniella mangroviensis CBS 8507 TaxID=1296122 RepID=UPI00080D2119|nr:uncharacterized protein I203_04553 [Kwoniella mangroviensis CBS 8507]OCF66226.1 hypothetical protein I203_04553 [Kwoniella mangroviensis CBS 8507]OCF71136.1 hypothetical protein I204_08088 [Kwoniella mangroviensis CBS 8886]